MKKIKTQLQPYYNSVNNNDHGFSFSPKSEITNNEVKIILDNINTIQNYDIIINKKTSLNKTSKILNLFFDIDSTITHGDIKTLDSNVSEIFTKLHNKDCRIFFCTGRDRKEVNDLNTLYNMDSHGIAEAGGVIIGAIDLPSEHFGNNTNPSKFINYLKEKKIPHKVDPKQRIRETEMVLLKSFTEEKVLRNTIRDSNIDVECNTTKNTYHITKKGITKGTAIRYLSSPSQLNLNRLYHIRIGVGDSDLDIPMFKECDESFAILDCSTNVRKVATVLNSNPPEFLNELYCKLFN